MHAANKEFVMSMFVQLDLSLRLQEAERRIAALEAEAHDENRWLRRRIDALELCLTSMARSLADKGTVTNDQLEAI